MIDVLYGYVDHASVFQDRSGGLHDGDDYCACAYIGAVSRAARRSYSVVLEVPSVPLLILALLAFVAIFAPVLLTAS